MKQISPLFSEEILTARLALRPPRAADAEEMFQRYTSDPAVTRYLTWQPHRDVRETREFLQQAIAGWKQRDKFAWLIADRKDARLLGMIELRVDRFKAEVGYVLARDAWGQGYMTEALRAVVAEAFSAPQIHRVWAACGVENTASARVLKQAGLQREALLRKFALHPNHSDKPTDAYCYSIVREEA